MTFKKINYGSRKTEIRSLQLKRDNARKKMNYFKSKLNDWELQYNFFVEQIDDLENIEKHDNKV